MKNRIYIVIAGILATAGITIFNNTGTDIILKTGEVIETHNLPKSLTKIYRERNIEDSLTIVIHHTAAPKTQSLENIAKFHVEKKGWPAIAYHIAINDDGDIHFLNDIERKTYHNSVDNTNTIGIVAIGNYENYEPSDDLIDSIRAVTEALCLSLKIKSIKGHRDYKATDCPGEYLQRELKQEIYFK